MSQSNFINLIKKPYILSNILTLSIGIASYFLYLNLKTSVMNFIFGILGGIVVALIVQFQIALLFLKMAIRRKRLKSNLKINFKEITFPEDYLIHEDPSKKKRFFIHEYFAGFELKKAKNDEKDQDKLSERSSNNSEKGVLKLDSSEIKEKIQKIIAYGNTFSIQEKNFAKALLSQINSSFDTKILFSLDQNFDCSIFLNDESKKELIASLKPFLNENGADKLKLPNWQVFYMLFVHLGNLHEDVSGFLQNGFISHSISFQNEFLKDWENINQERNNVKEKVLSKQSEYNKKMQEYEDCKEQYEQHFEKYLDISKKSENYNLIYKKEMEMKLIKANLETLEERCQECLQDYNNCNKLIENINEKIKNFDGVWDNLRSSHLVAVLRSVLFAFEEIVLNSQKIFVEVVNYESFKEEIEFAKKSKSSNIENEKEKEKEEIIHSTIFDEEVIDSVPEIRCSPSTKNKDLHESTMMLKKTTSLISSNTFLRKFNKEDTFEIREEDNELKLALINLKEIFEKNKEHFKKLENKLSNIVKFQKEIMNFIKACHEIFEKRHMIFVENMSIDESILNDEDSKVIEIWNIFEKMKIEFQEDLNHQNSQLHAFLSTLKNHLNTMDSQQKALQKSCGDSIKNFGKFLKAISDKIKDKNISKETNMNYLNEKVKFQKSMHNNFELYTNIFSQFEENLPYYKLKFLSIFLTNNHSNQILMKNAVYQIEDKISLFSQRNSQTQVRSPERKLKNAKKHMSIIMKDPLQTKQEITMKKKAEFFSIDILKQIQNDCKQEFQKEEFLTKLLHTYFLEWYRNPTFYEKIKKKLLIKLNKNNPPIISEFQILNVYLDSIAPKVLDFRPQNSYSFEFLCDFDLEFNGTFKIHVQTEVMLQNFININIPVDFKLEVIYFKGTLRMCFVPLEFGKSWISFVGEPTMEINMLGAVGNSGLLIHKIPMVTDIIFHIVLKKIKKLIYPNRSSIKIPMIKKIVKNLMDALIKLKKDN